MLKFIYNKMNPYIGSTPVTKISYHTNHIILFRNTLFCTLLNQHLHTDSLIVKWNSSPNNRGCSDLLCTVGKLCLLFTTYQEEIKDNLCTQFLFRIQLQRNPNKSQSILIITVYHNRNRTIGTKLVFKKIHKFQFFFKYS